MMPLVEIKKPYESIFSNRLFRFLGTTAASILGPTGISPSGVTLLNNVFALIAAVLFLRGSHAFIVSAALCMFVSHTLDYADGVVARKRALCSKYGEWLDETADKMVEPIVFIGITAGHYLLHLNPYIWFYGMIAVVARMSTVILVCNTERFTGEDRTILREEVSRGLLSRIFMFNKGNVVLLLLFFSIFNRIDLFLIVIAAYGMIFNVGAFFYMNRTIRRAGLARPIPVVDGEA